ncbi:MAG: hypothetical protein VX498_08585, partial [Myxococcota bacterium]|nr:hypothetical protein [Myxococcota bacterium]
FDAVGYRALHGTCGLLLALSGCVLGNSLGRSERWAWVGLVVLALNPYVLSLPQPDENLLALAWFAPAVLLLLSTKPRWLLGGVLLGLSLTMRHVLILSLPAFAVLVMAAPARRRAAGLLLLGLGLATFFEHLHHALALGSVLRFESNAQFAPQAYSIFGGTLHWEGMLNWPIHDRLVRTPHVPLPTLLRWPLHLADLFGVLGMALGLVGFVAGWRRSKKLSLFWALCFVPTYLLLALQESWDFPNKMGVLVTLLLPLAAWLMTGLLVVVERPRFHLGVVALLGLVLFVALPRLGSVDAPADPRYYSQFPETPPEAPALLEQERDRLLDLGLLPDYGRLSDAGPLWDRGLHRSLAALFAGKVPITELRPWGWHRTELPRPGLPTTLELDLAGLASTGRIAVKSTAEAPDLDLTGRGPVIFRGRGLDGGEGIGPLLAYAWRGPEVSTLAFVLPRPSDEGGELCSCSWTDGEFDPPCDGRCSVLAEVTGLDLLEGTGAVPAPPVASLSGSRMRIRIPSGGLSVLVLELPFANRFLLWRVLTGPGSPVIDGPWRPWHS